MTIDRERIAMTDLNELIEKIEVAGSNDPELFWEAFNAVHGPKPERVHGGSKEMDDYLAKSNPYFYFVKAGAFLDAAMSLVPDGFIFGCGSKDATKTAWAWVSPDEPLEYRSITNAATPALALCAAALKARAILSKQDPEYSGWVEVVEEGE